MKNLAKYKIIFAMFISMTINVSDLRANKIEPPEIENFITLGLTDDEEKLNAALEEITKSWSNHYASMILEATSFARNAQVYWTLIDFLSKQTNQKFGYDTNTWFEWIWSQEYQPHPDYAKFKSTLYGLIDPVFGKYFSNERTANIRLDEVRWGGVKQDGIPPLRQPKMISVGDSSYLHDSNIVFGLEINGDARAYPKRILAWHEMFIDEIGGESITGVYCTLCGTVIIYNTVENTNHYDLGTSGFLYRSNKLMYDKKTQSLWNTFKGVPIIGPLADKNIKLAHNPVVTTTWGEWKKRHPKSQVLSLDTGHNRNYDEGFAYQAYFATDELMFAVPKLDNRLNNKSEILGLTLTEHEDKPLAISVDYLANNPLYHDHIESTPFVALTDESGAIRVYESKGQIFKQWDQNHKAVDSNNISWQVSESKLESKNGDVLYRLPANRAFWFGWYSSYPHTRLVM